MSSQATMRIFDATAKSAAVLGLKTDEVNGVFLALEQMVSKGKVTTEELRRQLGERLPGAFGIMADAIGVSLRELDRMLKAGEVLSADALPKFADALEEAYGTESIKKVDTLAAAQGRLKTSWINFIDSLQTSSVYIGVIDHLTQSFAKFASLVGDGSRDLELYSQRTDKAGAAVRTFTKSLDNIVNNKITEETEEFWTGWLDKVGFSTKQATRFWDQYIQKRSSTERDLSGDPIKIFDFETQKKEFDRIKKAFEDLSNIQDKNLREMFLAENTFIEGSSDTFEKYIERQKKLYDEELTAAKETYEAEEEAKKMALNNYQQTMLLYEDSDAEWAQNLLKESRLAYQEQNKITEASLASYQAILEYRTLLEKRELEKSKKQEKDYTKWAISLREKLIDAAEADFTERLSLARNNFEEQRAIEKEFIQFQLDNYDLTLTERAKLNAKLRELDDDLFQYRIDEEISGIYERADEARIAEAERVREEFQSTKKRGQDKQLIMAQSAMNMIQIEKDAINEILAIEELSLEERKKYEHELAQLKEQYAEADIQLSEYTEKKKREQITKTLDAAKQVNQESFNFALALNERAMEVNETRYRRETEQAGENAEEKAKAEVKYNQKKRELLRREAIAQKAQSAFSVIIDTAQAIMATLGETGFLGLPLVPIVAGIGALQLATVLAQPIPQFAKGTESAPETFIAGEKKRELIFTKKGDTILTPNKPTLFSGKEFLGSTILPNDQTEMILNGKSGGSLDLSSTNTLLKDIRDKKDNKETIEYIGGYKIVRKKGFVGKYRVA
ncbi:MAG: tape measure protein, partial [bacterium]